MNLSRFIILSIILHTLFLLIPLGSDGDIGEAEETPFEKIKPLKIYLNNGSGTDNISGQSSPKELTDKEWEELIKIPDQICRDLSIPEER